MTQRNRGLEVIHTFIFAQIQSLSHLMRKTNYSDPKRREHHASHPPLSCVWCLVWCVSCMVARQISSIHMTRKHLHQTCSVSSASCTSACALKEQFTARLLLFFFFTTIQICYFFCGTQKEKLWKLLFFFFFHNWMRVGFFNRCC